jgi:hypothetical protein
MSTSNLITDLLADIKTKIDANSYFVGPPAIATVINKPGDELQELLRQQVGMMAGVAINLAALTPGTTPHEVGVVISFICIENPDPNRDTVSGTEATYLDIALLLYGILLGWQPTSTPPWWMPLQFVGGELLDREEDGRVAFEMKFATAVQMYM